MISYSLSFGARARCKFCLSGPKYFSCVFSGNLSKDVLVGIRKSIDYQRKSSLSRAGVNYLFLPKKGMKLSHASSNVAYSRINVRRYKNLKPRTETGKFLFKASFSCECFKTAWVTRDMLLLEKNHISQRLSFKSYPTNIILV